MKMKYAIALLTCVGVVGSAQAAEINWDGTGTSDAGLAANWVGGVAPGAADQMQIRNGGTSPVITADTTVTEVSMGGMAWRGTVAATVPNTLTLQSGTLTATGWFLMGFEDNTTNTFNMSGGTLNVGTDFFIGAHEGGSGTYNMSGGTATAGNFAIGWPGAGGGDPQFGQVYLTGGTITSGNFYLEPAGQLDITDGDLYVNDDRTGDVATWIGSSQLTAFGGSGTVLSSYNAGTNQTHISGVIPEPATFGLVALMGGGLLFVRKCFKI